MVCPSVVIHPSFTLLKDLLLQNRFANQSQILCGASLGRGNESLFAASGSHNQDGSHAHIWSNKTLQKSSSPEPAGRLSRNLVCSIGDSSPSYCGFGNFRVTFVSQFFHFRIICEFLNSRASIRVVCHFRGLKIGALCISCERQINAMYRIAVYAVHQLKLEILFVFLFPQRDNHSVCNTYVQSLDRI